MATRGRVRGALAKSERISSRDTRAGLSSAIVSRTVILSAAKDPLRRGKRVPTSWILRGAQDDTRRAGGIRLAGRFPPPDVLPRRRDPVVDHVLEDREREAAGAKNDVVEFLQREFRAERLLRL